MSSQAIWHVDVSHMLLRAGKYNMCMNIVYRISHSIDHLSHITCRISYIHTIISSYIVSCRVVSCRVT